jgi:hypothetical protein
VPPQIDDTLTFLVGKWTIARAIEDHRSGIRGSFEGSATLAEPASARGGLQEERVRYDEAGELRFGNHMVQAHRSFDYVQLNDATVMIYFLDGRPFVDLDLRTGAWESTHVCDEDRHEIATLVRSRGVVEERWRVRGPATDYAATTIHTRIS